MDNYRYKRGIILVMSIVILILLTVLAMSMIGISWGIKVISSSYIETTQSEFMADSAIEYAATKILAYQNKTLVATLQTEWVFPGEDFNKNGVLDPPDEDINNNGMLDTANLDLQETVLPSFPNPEIEIISFNNKFYVPSMLHKEWRGKNVNSYTFIKAVDTSSLICVNNYENPGLRLILNNLADYLNIDKRLGDLLFEYIASVSETDNISINLALLEQVWKIDDKKKMNTILNELSLFCWEDKKVIKPAPSKNILMNLERREKYDIDRLDRINDNIYEFGSFAPLNVNLAPVIIIKSTLKNLSSLYFIPNKIENVQVPNRISKLSDVGSSFWDYYVDLLYKQQKPIGFVKKVILTKEDVDNVVKELEDIRKERLTVGDPLAYNWEEFYIFAQNLIAKKILSYEKSMLLFANANPNIHSFKFNPTFTKADRIDRLDLIDYTTTYNFFPTGTFKIEAYNMFLDKNYQIIARNYKSVYANLYQTINETTTADFLQGTIPIASTATLNNKTLNVGPLPVSLYKQAKFPNFDGFIEVSSLVAGRTIDNDIVEKINKGYGPIIFKNFIKKKGSINNFLESIKLQYSRSDAKNTSLPMYSLLWDGVNYNLLDSGIKNQYIKIFTQLYKKIIDENENDPGTITNMCFWFKLQALGDIEQNVVPFFNISGYKDDLSKTPYHYSFFNLRKTRTDMLYYNILHMSSEESHQSIYFTPREIVEPIANIEIPFPNSFFLVCLAFGGEDGISLYINGNKVARQKEEIEDDNIISKVKGNIDIEKSLANIFMNGTIDYVVYIFEGKENDKENSRLIKKTFSQRYCINCKDISYTTRQYMIYALDRNCVVNLYWTDNATATNLPDDVYNVIEHFSLFEADVLDENDRILNIPTGVSGKDEKIVISFDSSVGSNDNPPLCSNKFKVKLSFKNTEKNQTVLEAPAIDDIYIMVYVPKYKQVLFNEVGKFK